MRKTLSKQFAHITTGGAVERQLAFFNSWCSSQPTRGGEKLGRFPRRSGVAEGEDRIGGEWAAGRSYRSLLHGSDELFSTQLILRGGGAERRSRNALQAAYDTSILAPVWSKRTFRARRSTWKLSSRRFFESFPKAT